jgi:hypothetical protein
VKHLSGITLVSLCIRYDDTRREGGCTYVHVAFLPEGAMGPRVNRVYLTQVYLVPGITRGCAWFVSGGETISWLR